jgi:hypothetical protein
MVAHTCNSSYLGSGVWRIESSMPAGAKVERPCLKNKTKLPKELGTEVKKNWGQRSSGYALA